MKKFPAVTMAIAAALLSCRPIGEDWTVLSKSEARALMRPCSRAFPAGLSGYWSPGRAEIERAEARFQEALTRLLERLPQDERPNLPPIWYAQYAGFFRDGHKVIYVNALGRWPNGGDFMMEGWRDRAIVLCDGGTSFFGAVFDLDRDAVDSFEFNGPTSGWISRDSVDGVGSAQADAAADGSF